MGRLTGEYEHVFSGDPALESDAATFDLWGWAERGDESLLCIRSGEKPHRYTLRHVSGRALARLRDRIRESGSDEITHELLYEACALGLVAVTPGTSNGVPATIRRVVDRRVERVADEVMEQLYDVADGGLVAELGARVIREMIPSPKR